MAYFRTPEAADDVAWDGRIYRRHPGHKNRSMRCYHMATTAPRTYLHRDIWEKTNGPIPDGWHVHHKDHNTLNNDLGNLIALSPEDHSTEHSDDLREHEISCGRCAKTFTAGTPWALWCSPACKEAQRRIDGKAYVRPLKGPTRISKACDNCDEAFVALKPWGRFCTPRCKQAFARKLRSKINV